ncbi:hypothetical protein D0815_23295 [Vibrio parahaemolyticus]|nr:hypothetical protein [Vibrio parahaemolyticus]
MLYILLNSQDSQLQNITKRLRQIRNAWHFRFALNFVFTAQWFRFRGLRCSLLNAALYRNQSSNLFMALR